MMTASLPMYDRPELLDAHNEYWNNIHLTLKERGIDSSGDLDRSGCGIPFWTSKNLVLSQTCGMPYRKYLHEKVGLVGTPDFAVDGCPSGYYCSHLVVRKCDSRESLVDYKDALFAFNESDSQSGFAAPWNHLRSHNHWFEKTVQTNAHVASAEFVAVGKAEIASIDAVTWRFIEKYDACADDLRILETTEPTPGLPYITSANLDPDIVFEAVKAAIKRTDGAVLAELGIRKITRIEKSEYLKVPNPDVT